MRPLVNAAVQSSSAHMRKLTKDTSKIDRRAQKPLSPSDPLSSRKMKHYATKPDPDTAHGRDSSGEGGKPPIDFEKTSTSTPKSVNDIVQGPPQIKHLPRNSQKILAASGKSKKSDAVVSMAQKAMMEVERENAIQRYRQLKERRSNQHQKNSDADS